MTVLSYFKDLPLGRSQAAQYFGVNYLLVVFLFFSHCKGDSNKTKILRFQNFEVTVPGDWRRYTWELADYEEHGITNEIDSIWYEYNVISKSPFIVSERQGQLYMADTVNGFLAFISIPDSATVGFTRLLIPNIGNGYELQMSGYIVRDVKTVLRIFKSVRVAGSDTTKNPQLSFEKFTSRVPRGAH